MNQPCLIRFMPTSKMSVAEAFKVAKSVLKNMSLHDTLNIFGSIRTSKSRRAAAYVRSTNDNGSAQPNAAADFAHRNNMTIGTYFFDRLGELGALSLIAERRSDFDVLVVDAHEREALEHNDAFLRAVSGLEVMWMVDVVGTYSSNRENYDHSRAHTPGPCSSSFRPYLRPIPSPGRDQMQHNNQQYNKIDPRELEAPLDERERIRESELSRAMRIADETMAGRSLADVMHALSMPWSEVQQALLLQ